MAAATNETRGIVAAFAQELGLTTEQTGAALDAGKLKCSRTGALSIGPHDCDDHAVPYTSDGALGHGFECGICGAFLQAG